jgi:hypothetical protein
MHGPVLIDARLKPGFPARAAADRETAALVTRRWREYFPAGVEMGDAEAAHSTRCDGDHKYPCRISTTH